MSESNGNPKAEPPRLTMRQARAEVATVAAEVLAGAAQKCLDDASKAPKDSTARSNALLLALAARELAAVLVEGAKKLEQRIVVPGTLQ